MFIVVNYVMWKIISYRLVKVEKTKQSRRDVLVDQGNIDTLVYSDLLKYISNKTASANIWLNQM